MLVDQTDYRRARRRYHYGDEHEVGTTNCLTAWTNSTTWDTRHAVRVRERAAHGLVACVDCGIVCEGRDEMDGTDATPWEADHEVPLEDGGPHTLDNLRCRCVPCHRAKTRAENRARADKRRVDKAQATA